MMKMTNNEQKPSIVDWGIYNSIPPGEHIVLKRLFEEINKKYEESPLGPSEFIKSLNLTDQQKHALMSIGVKWQYL